MKTAAKSGIMNSLHPEGKKEFDEKARKTAQEAEKIAKDFGQIAWRIQRRTYKNQEALDSVSQHQAVCRSIGAVLTTVTKTSFTFLDLQDHLAAYADFGHGVQYRLWKQETVEKAILGKVEDVRSLLENGCAFLPDEEGRRACRERVIQAALEATVLPLAQERDGEKLEEKTGRVARLCAALADRRRAPPGTSHYVSDDAFDDLASLGAALSLWNPEFAIDSAPNDEWSSSDNSWQVVQEARHLRACSLHNFTR